MKLITRFLCWLLFAGLHLTAIAQTERRINFSLGPGLVSTQDLTVSRFVGQGMNLYLNAAYELNAVKSQQYAMLGFATGKISSTTDYNSSLSQLFSLYGYNHHVFHFAKWNAFLGGESSNGLIVRTTTSINQNQPSSSYFALRLTMRGVVNLPNEQQLQFSVKLPLFAYTIRPGYANSTPDGLIGQSQDLSHFSRASKAGNWSGIDKFNYTNVSVQYTKKFARAMSVRWAYTFSWFGFDDPVHSQRMTLLNNELTFTLSYWMNHPKDKK